jgi:hypothetical protein
VNPLNTGSCSPKRLQRSEAIERLERLERGILNELHALSDDVCSSVFDQKMNVIGCHNVIEHTKSKARLRPPSSGFERFERSEAIERLERFGTGFNVGA